MFSDDEMYTYSDEGDEDEEITIDLEEPISDSNSNHNSEFPYEVLSTDSIRKYMSDCIKEVNIVVQVIFIIIILNIIILDYTII